MEEALFQSVLKSLTDYDGINTDEDKNLWINYESSKDGSKKRHKWEIGLLAQEALAAEKAHTDLEQCKNDTDGHPEDWCDEGLLVTGTNSEGYRFDYEALVGPLVKAVQDLASCIDAKNTALAARVTTLEG